MPPSDFYDPGILRQTSINLFNGWGYNFYRVENQLRADDLLVRSKVSWLLGLARHSVEAAEQDYRREFLPPPSREKPRPDPNSIAYAQQLEHLSQSLGALEGQIRAQPVPENDRILQRHRKEARMIETLLALDRTLVGRAELLRLMLEQKTAAWIIENIKTLNGNITAVADSLKNRQEMLLAG